jgi:hypothetical protein
MKSYTVHTSSAMKVLSRVYSEISHISCVITSTPYTKRTPKCTFVIALMRNIYIIYNIYYIYINIYIYNINIYIIYNYI